MHSQGTRIFLEKNRSARAVALRKAPRTHTPSLSAFRSTVLKYWRENGRHDLPWRKTKVPYRILVSEVMLQQTQVSRVIEKYKEFLKQFPTVQALAKASLSDVLRVWSGLGYNRRGKYLHDAAKVIVEKHRGKFPKDFVALRSLPGLGEYTAGAVRAFAFNEPETLIETNIRAAFIHHFCPGSKDVTDKQLLPMIVKAAEGQDPRTWYWALMDYGVHIKKLHKNPARKSTHHVRQSKFEGSLRQVRGAILRSLHSGPKTENQLTSRSNLEVQGRTLKKVGEALRGLERDGLVVKKRGRWVIK